MNQVKCLKCPDSYPSDKEFGWGICDRCRGRHKPAKIRHTDVVNAQPSSALP